MFKLPKLDVATSVRTVIFAQSALIVGLMYILKLSQSDAQRYTEAIVYYESILEREGIEFTDYDLIALSTLFEPDIKGMTP